MYTTGEKAKRKAKKNMDGRSISGHDNEESRTRSVETQRGLFGDVAAYAATSPNSPQRRILTDCFNHYDFS